MAITKMQVPATLDDRAATALYCALATRYPNLIALPTLERGDKDAIEATAGVTATTSQQLGPFTRQLYLHVWQELAGLTVTTTLTAATLYSGNEPPTFTICSCAAEFNPLLNEDEASRIRWEMPVQFGSLVQTEHARQTRPLKPAPPMFMLSPPV